MGCDRCDTFGGEKTYRNQALMPLNGKVQCIDWCIHHIVAALNAGGVRTVASCCGHKEMLGLISLEDGRQLLVVDTFEEAERMIRSSKLRNEGPNIVIHYDSPTP